MFSSTRFLFVCRHIAWTPIILAIPCLSAPQSTLEQVEQMSTFPLHTRRDPKHGSHSVRKQCLVQRVPPNGSSELENTILVLWGFKTKPCTGDTSRLCTQKMWRSYGLLSLGVQGEHKSAEKSRSHGLGFGGVQSKPVPI